MKSTLTIVALSHDVPEKKSYVSLDRADNPTKHLSLEVPCRSINSRRPPAMLPMHCRPNSPHTLLSILDYWTALSVPALRNERPVRKAFRTLEWFP